MSVTSQLVAAVWLAFTPPPGAATAAAGERRVGVAPASIDGELEASRSAGLQTALVDGLRNAGWVTLDAVVRCDDDACRRQSLADVRAAQLVQLRARVHRRDWEIAIELYGADGALLLSADEDCQVCGFREVEALVTAQAAALRGRLDALRPPPPLLLLETTPPGATATVDGVAVGTTPLEAPVEVGAHEVRFARAGYVPAAREVDGVQGVRTHLAITLVPTADARAGKRWRAAGWSLVGIGAAAVIVGPTLIGVDGTGDRTRCSGDRVDADGDCAFVLATRGAGIATLVVGAAMLTAGLVFARHRRLGQRLAIGGRGPLLRF